ncbi:hypothetical protein MMC25_006800 [Agyrium rufum]|nr:hypothetical protein [Agyrium rufum]
MEEIAFGAVARSYENWSYDESSSGGKQGPPSSMDGTGEAPFPNRHKPATNSFLRSKSKKLVGKRKGPVRPDRRKQAIEVRKRNPCIRCWFLKKTCDQAEPCGGCTNASRNWQMPCTRLDIKDLGYFLKDWRADFEASDSYHSVDDITGFYLTSHHLLVTHGYEIYLPLQVREFNSRKEDSSPAHHYVFITGRHQPGGDFDTARLHVEDSKLLAGLIMEYTAKHVDDGLGFFLSKEFAGIPLISDVLRSVYHFWQQERNPIIREALKFLVAYNLTTAACFAAIDTHRGARYYSYPYASESPFEDLASSSSLVYSSLKQTMSGMWRELHDNVLQELSHLYRGVYSGDKLKNWPFIFSLSLILLVVWEEIQRDTHNRLTTKDEAETFCNKMESTPLKLILGLFRPVSQKLPAFADWDTEQHQGLLGSRESVNRLMEEMKSHVQKHDTYLKTRRDLQFSPDDPKRFSNKLVSQLILREP